MDTVFALVDCTNFYCSCERLFEPRLWDRPVAVLSNNDGCVVARSQRVKEAGVPMGAPYFQHKGVLRRIGAEVRSSNYTLYADLSRRVMLELEAVALDIERYSIDEAFLALPALPPDDLAALGTSIRQRIWRYTGIPIRIGIGPSKTLAKVADTVAKQTDGVFVCPDEPALTRLLDAFEVGDVWGIGSASVQKLAAKGIDTAHGFRALPDAWIRSAMTVTGLRTAYELRGVSCIPLEVVPPDRKTMVRSRSFAGRIHDRTELEQAVSKHAQRAAEKLRQEDLVARGLQAFITTKRFGPKPHYGNSAGATLSQHTNHTPTLVRAAKTLLRRIYVPSIDGRPVGYKKAGVMLYDLRPRVPEQAHLFDARDPSDDALMEAVDEINRRYGSGTIGTAAAGIRGKRTWTMKSEHRSPRYTTEWTELPVIRL